MVIQPWLKSVLAMSHGGLSQGSHTLPAAEACKGFAREVRIDVRGTVLAKVLYDPFYFKRGKMSRWFCTGRLLTGSDALGSLSFATGDIQVACVASMGHGAAPSNAQTFLGLSRQPRTNERVCELGKLRKASTNAISELIQKIVHSPNRTLCVRCQLETRRPSALV